MDEATANAIGEATSRLDKATKLREAFVAGTAGERPPLFEHQMLVAEAQAWAALATAAACNGNTAAMPSIEDVMAELVGARQSGVLPDFSALGDVAGATDERP